MPQRKGYTLEGFSYLKTAYYYFLKIITIKYCYDISDIKSVTFVCLLQILNR